MIVEFKCPICGIIKEDYFPTYKSFLNNIPVCCDKKMERLYGGSYVRPNGMVVSGYEKENQDNLTIGKAIDMKQKWF